MSRFVPRRRALTVLAASCAAVPAALWGLSGAARPVTWEGRALGTTVSIALDHPDSREARAALDACVAEIRRLEAELSLYRADSAVSDLNRTGTVAPPPADLAAVLTRARAVAAASGGAFDPTVQPLWTLYMRHFADPEADPAGPPASAVNRALARVDWRRLTVDADAARLTGDGTAVTLNGIAQGWVTDRVAEVLRARGLTHVMVDLGEPRALGPRADGTAWRIGVADPRDPRRALTVLEKTEGATATSGGYGTRLDPAGRFTHLFDPRTGGTAAPETAVTVSAARAATADALSTALATAAPGERGAILRAVDPAATARVVGPDGTVTKVTA